MKIYQAALLAIAASSVSVSADAKKKPEPTPMELQALQSREYETTKEQIFASAVSVFQDLGYQVSNADMTSGFVTAESAAKNKTGFWDAMGGVTASGNTRATAFVESMPNGMARVRLNFLNIKNSSGSWGRNNSEGKPILDPQTYAVAFDKIEQALFERAALTKTTPSAAMPVGAVAEKPTVEIPVTPGLTIQDSSAPQAAAAPKQ